MKARGESRQKNRRKPASQTKRGRLRFSMMQLIGKRHIFYGLLRTGTVLRSMDSIDDDSIGKYMFSFYLDKPTFALSS